MNDKLRQRSGTTFRYKIANVFLRCETETGSRNIMQMCRVANHAVCICDESQDGSFVLLTSLRCGLGHLLPGELMARLRDFDPGDFGETAVACPDRRLFSDIHIYIYM